MLLVTATHTPNFVDIELRLWIARGEVMGSVDEKTITMGRQQEVYDAWACEHQEKIYSLTHHVGFTLLARPTR
jgi:hypothetical protein